MPLAELRKKLDTGEISVKELAGDYISRIKKEDGGLNAYLYVNGDGAVAAAAARAQAEIDAGRQTALTGIPIALDDSICTSDMPTTCASRMLDGYRSPFDAAAAEKLRAHGAVLLGKLNIDEFAMGYTARTSYYKRTNNPYDITRTPGGPSGGAAAATAAGLCAAALGAGAGAALSCPAAFCGVTGFSPTYGRVSRHGLAAFSSSFDRAGPVAQSAVDCAILLDAVSGPCARDRATFGHAGLDNCAAGITARPASSAGPSRADGSVPKGLRIGVVREILDSDTVDSSVRECVKRAAAWFGRAGAEISEVSLPLLRFSPAAFYIISNAEASANLARFDGVRFGHSAQNAGDYRELIVRSRAEGFGYEAKLRILFGTFALSSGSYDIYYGKASRLMGALRGQYDEIFSSYDLLLSPAAPSVAFKTDAGSAAAGAGADNADAVYGTIAGEGRDAADPAGFDRAYLCTAGASLAGLPSVSTPCGYIGGLPVGLMITGRRWDDSLVLAAAAAFEREFERVAAPSAAAAADSAAGL